MSKRYDVRLQIALASALLPLTVKRLQFRLVGPNRYEFQMDNVKAYAAVVAIHAAEARVRATLRLLGVLKFEVVKVGAELTKGRTG